MKTLITITILLIGCTTTRYSNTVKEFNVRRCSDSVFTVHMEHWRKVGDTFSGCSGRVYIIVK